jgi:Tn3 transposase DDE domain
VRGQRAPTVAGFGASSLKWASDAVLTFMHRHSTSATWGRADLASADMMSLETNKRVFLARNDPRRQTASIGNAKSSSPVDSLGCKGRAAGRSAGSSPLIAPCKFVPSVMRSGPRGCGIAQSVAVEIKNG